MTKKEELMKILSVKLRRVLDMANLNYDWLQELRLRINEPVIIRYNGNEHFVTEQGNLVQESRSGYCVNQTDMKETIEYISSFSLYAYEDEIRQGFITVQGGHRIGIAGKVILEQGKIKSIKYISFINIRMSHEKKGCGQSLLPYIYMNNQICHTLHQAVERLHY